MRAGLDLLAEQGWAGLTARAVAQRAGTHPGLLHYHFGGLPALRRAVAAAAVRDAVEPALAVLTAADSWQAGLAAAVRAGAGVDGPGPARVMAELVTASLQDPEVGALVRDVLGEARAGLVPWLTRIGAPEPEGFATLLVAALDGLALHRLIDPGLPLDRVAAAVQP